MTNLEPIEVIILSCLGIAMLIKLAIYLDNRAVHKDKISFKK